MNAVSGSKIKNSNNNYHCIRLNSDPPSKPLQRAERPFQTANLEHVYEELNLHDFVQLSNPPYLRRPAIPPHFCCLLADTDEVCLLPLSTSKSDLPPEGAAPLAPATAFFLDANRNCVVNPAIRRFLECSLWPTSVQENHANRQSERQRSEMLVLAGRFARRCPLRDSAVAADLRFD